MTDTPDEGESAALDDGNGVSWEDQEAAKKINGVYANRLFIQSLETGLLRLNFGQMLGDDPEPTYHSAVVVSASNVLLFIDLMARVVGTHFAPPIEDKTPPETDDGG